MHGRHARRTVHRERPVGGRTPCCAATAVTTRHGTARRGDQPAGYDEKRCIAYAVDYRQPRGRRLFGQTTGGTVTYDTAAITAAAAPAAGPDDRYTYMCTYERCGPCSMVVSYEFLQTFMNPNLIYVNVIARAPPVLPRVGFLSTVAPPFPGRIIARFTNALPSSSPPSTFSAFWRKNIDQIPTVLFDRSIYFLLEFIYDLYSL